MVNVFEKRKTFFLIMILWQLRTGNNQLATKCVVEEEHYSLKCRWKNSSIIKSMLKNEDNHIIWGKMDKANKTVNISAEVNNRIYVKGDILEFWPITPNDSGKYACFVQNMQSRADTLRVEKKNWENCIDSSCIRKVRTMRHKYLTIPCFCTEDYIKKYDSVVLYKNCDVYKTNVTEVSFDAVQHSDEGIYTFVITVMNNGQKYNVTRKTELIVQEPDDVLKPYIKGIGNVTTVDVELGTNLTLECEAFVGYINKSTRDMLFFWLQKNKTNIIKLHGTKNEFLFVKNCPDTISTTCGTSMRTKYAEGSLTIHTELHIISANYDDIKYPYKCKMDSIYDGDYKLFILKIKEKSHDISQGSFTTSLVAAIVCFVCMVFLVALCIFFRIELVLLYRGLTGKDDTADDGKEYDAYLSFLNNSNTEDEVEEDEEGREFASHVLPTVLENDFGYKLCIFERDVIPGGVMTEDIHSFLEKSRRLIILLNKNSISDNSMFELESGLHKAMVERKIKVIFIEYTPLSELKAIPQSLQLLKTSNRVKWEGKRSRPLKSTFWKQIRYLMPAKPIKPTISLKNIQMAVLSE